MWHRNPELGLTELWYRLRKRGYTRRPESLFRIMRKLGMRLRFLAAYPEQSTYSSADFLKKLVKWYARRGIRVECVQTDNGFEFINCFVNTKRDLPTKFELTAAKLGIRHKLIRPFTPKAQRQS